MSDMLCTHCWYRGYRVTHLVSDYILLTFVWEVHHVAYMPCQFCQICSCLSRIRQTYRNFYIKFNKMKSPTWRVILYTCLSEARIGCGEWRGRRRQRHGGQERRARRNGRERAHGGGYRGRRGWGKGGRRQQPREQPRIVLGFQKGAV